jgi:hypothetical protein
MLVGRDQKIPENHLISNRNGSPGHVSNYVPRAGTGFSANFGGGQGFALRRLIGRSASAATARGLASPTGIPHHQHRPQCGIAGQAKLQPSTGLTTEKIKSARADSIDCA